MNNYGTLSFTPLSPINSLSDNIAPVLFCLNVKVMTNKPWSYVKYIVDKLHMHICVHATMSDVKHFLDRNGIWNDDAERSVK